MKKISIIGGGWRTETWIKVIRSLSEEYELGTVYCRNAERSKNLSDKYGVIVNKNYKKIYVEKPYAVITCASKDENSLLSVELIKNGINVLAETPFSIGDDFFNEQDSSYGKLRIAENYIYHPTCLAYNKIIDDGVIGEVGSVEISFCHGYHASAVIRTLLGVGDKLPSSVKNINLNDIYTDTHYRYGRIPEKINDHNRLISYLTYGDKYAIYDFSEGQYFSDIRKRYVRVRGDKGEICGDTVNFIENGNEQSIKIERKYDGTEGSLYPLDLKRITFGGKELFVNPYKGKSFSEEEISMAICLDKFIGYVKTGKNDYSLTEAVCDFETAKIMER